MKRRTIALILSVMMLVSLLSAIPFTNVSAADQEFTGTVGGDFNTATQGNVKVTAPTQVNVGDTFEIVYEFTNLEVVNGAVGCFVVNNVIDTRYVHITAADPSSVYIKECDISTWTDASNYGTVAGLAAIEATDKTAENLVDFNWGFVNEEVIDAIDDSITVVGKYVATTAGTTTIKAYDLNVNELYYAWEGYFEPATFDIEIDIVDPSATPEDPEPAPTQEFTGTVGGDFNTATQGNVKVTAPTQVNVGETFEIVYEFTNLEVVNGAVGCFVVNNVIDTRYVHITAADPTSVYIKECDISTWTDASNYGTVAGLAAIEA
ncbi:MAG: hypothetical protein IJB65_05120, partial [Clostridia bacterium]|nr:hypothetical protein [Clostridia bacterium]